MVARSRPGGIHLGLDKFKVDIWWQGYGGLDIRGLQRKLKYLLQFNTQPKFLLLHSGGNDIGKIPLKTLRSQLETLLEFLDLTFAGTKIIWSQILPRSTWRYSENLAAMNRCRGRLNNFAAHKLVSAGGYFIKHPDLQVVQPGLYKSDGVHLSATGNEIFLNQIAAGLEAFILHRSNMIN